METANDYAVILPAPEQRVVLLARNGDEWRLPGWSKPPGDFWQTTATINAAVAERYALRAVTLRCMALEYGTEPDSHLRIYELEALEGSGKLPPDHQWVDFDTAATITLSCPHEHEALTTWLREQREGRPPQRRPWARPGWFATACSWIDAALDRVERKRTGPIIQNRTWERSCVLEIPTEGGLVYFKAQPAVFDHDLPLLQLLTTWDPHRIPRLLAGDEARNWSLAANAGSATLEDSTDSEHWANALEAYANIQLRSVNYHESLLLAGVPERPLNAISDAIDDLWEKLELYPGLDDATIAALRARSSHLKIACGALQHYGLPLSIDHGDLWPTNIIEGPAGPVFIDWSDSTLTHPFFSMQLIFREELPRLFPQRPELAAELQMRYLAPWRERFPNIDVTGAFELAYELAPLHYALLYHTTILPTFEARWEMHFMVQWYLRMLL